MVSFSVPGGRNFGMSCTVTGSQVAFKVAHAPRQRFFAVLLMLLGSAGGLFQIACAQEPTRVPVAQPPRLNTPALLPPDRPDWVGEWVRIDSDHGYFEGDLHWITVPCEPRGSLAESQATMRESIDHYGRLYIAEFVLADDPGQGYELDDVTVDWMIERWRDRRFLPEPNEYHLVWETPSGDYHQVWLLMRCTPEDRQVLRNAALRRAYSLRMLNLGVLLGGGLGVMGLIYGGLGWWKLRRG
jgi:hypothetical protein